MQLKLIDAADHLLNYSSYLKDLQEREINLEDLYESFRGINEQTAEYFPSWKALKLNKNAKVKLERIIKNIIKTLHEIGSIIYDCTESIQDNLYLDIHCDNRTFNMFEMNKERLFPNYKVFWCIFETIVYQIITGKMLCNRNEFPIPIYSGLKFLCANTAFYEMEQRIIKTIRIRKRDTILFYNMKNMIRKTIIESDAVGVCFILDKKSIESILSLIGLPLLPRMLFKFIPIPKVANNIRLSFYDIMQGIQKYFDDQDVHSIDIERVRISNV